MGQGWGQDLRSSFLSLPRFGVRVCNSLSRNKGVEKRAPSLPRSFRGACTQHGLWGRQGDLMLGAPWGVNFGARKGSSGPLSLDPWLIPILGPREGSKVGPAGAQALQPEEPLGTRWPLRRGRTNLQLWRFFAPSRWGLENRFPSHACRWIRPPLPKPHPQLGSSV